MNVLRKPRLKSTVVSVAVETFLSASRLAADKLGIWSTWNPKAG
jgi:hypothetical protein